MFDNTFIHRVVYKTLWLALLPACMLWSVLLAVQQPAGLPLAQQTSAELPAQWQGQPLRPLALSEVEERFARRFPGTLSRLTDGRQVLVLRKVDKPTRMLHPAADCYQGLGYSVAAQQLELDADRQLWRCFEATRGAAGKAGAGQRLRVCERIVDAAGNGFTDASAWYWAAATGKSQGPWQAVTVARAL